MNEDSLQHNLQHTLQSRFRHGFRWLRLRCDAHLFIIFPTFMLMGATACSKTEKLASNRRGPACDLSMAEKQKAVATFATMMPTFNHPRCANCHGGIDVYAPSARDLHGGGQRHTRKVVDSSNFNAGLGPVEVSEDRDVAQCQSCHDVPAWNQPAPSENIAFAGRSASQICQQIKRKMSPAALAIHVLQSPLVLAGFEGRRGHNNLSPKPPPMTAADFQKQIAAWTAIVRARSKADDWQGGMESDCGCVVDGKGYRITDHERTESAKQGLGRDITYAADVIVDSNGEDYVGTGTYYGTVVTQKLNCHNSMPINRTVQQVSGMLDATASDASFGSNRMVSYTLTTRDWPVSLTIFGMGQPSASDLDAAHKMGGTMQMLRKLTGPRTELHDRTVNDGRTAGYMAGCSGDVTQTSDITIEEIH